MSDKKGVQGVNLKDFETPEGAGSQQKISEKKAYVKTFGSYDGAENTEPSSSGVIAHTRDAAVDETHQVERVTSVAGQSNKQAMDVAISHSNGDDITELQPLPIYLADNPGDEISVHDQSVNVVADGGTAEQNYTVSAGLTFKQLEVRCAATNESKFELQIETGVAAGTFTTEDVAFCSASSPTSKLKYPVGVPAGIIIKIVKTNYHNKDNDLYTTIQGLEI